MTAEMVKAAPVQTRPLLVQAAVQASGSIVNEEFRSLAARVRRIGEEGRFHVIGIVSAVSGEGKTTVALGLATALARATGQRVLLVEADLRKPAIEKYLGLARAPGVSEWLSGSNAGPVRMLAGWPVGVLPAGTARLETMDALGSERMAALLATARDAFTYVIVDCPPLTPVADAVALQEFLDGLLMVVRARHAPREALARAAERLKPGRIRGLVFIDEPEILAKDYSYGYRGYEGYGS